MNLFPVSSTSGPEKKMPEDLESDLFFDETKKIDSIDGLWWFKGDTGSWDGPSNDWNTRHYECIVKRCIDAGRTGIALQAGGNLGLYPKMLSRVFDHVFTFEAERKNFACLSRNVTESNVTKINAALGEKNGMISVQSLDFVNRGATRLHDDGGLVGLIPTFTVDQLTVPSLDLLWLDVEGYEPKVIAGARDTIRRCRPYVVAVETKTQDMEDFLGEVGYEFVENSVADKVYVLSR